MNTRRRFSLLVITLGVTVSLLGYSAPTEEKISGQVEQVAVGQPQKIVASNDAVVTFPRSEVVTIAAPSKITQIAEVADPGTYDAGEKSIVSVQPTVPVAQSPAPAVPATSPTPIVTAPGIPAPAQVTPMPVPVSPAFDREVYVGLAGGQNIVDLGRGPVLFPLPAGWPPYVAEHDGNGGWARFGTLSPGMKVKMSGLVGGTYTVGQIINVPKGGSTDEFRQFAAMPKVLLQTCVPGTNRMIVVGLY